MFISPMSGISLRHGVNSTTTMKTEQQNEIWALLPKEFKEEVKKSYRYYSCMAKDQHDLGSIHTFEAIFGVHNLTSDADGEEMLTANKKDVQEQYALQVAALRKGNLSDMEVEWRVKLKDMLYFLFGSKCLPDNVDSLSQNPAENCDKANHISTDDNKPAEPTRKEAKENENAFAFDAVSDMDSASCNISATHRLVDCNKQLDNILKDSFRKHNRLHIAATITAGVMANPNIIKSRSDLRAFSDEWLASRSLELADALIAECEKGE